MRRFVILGLLGVRRFLLGLGLELLVLVGIFLFIDVGFLGVGGFLSGSRRRRRICGSWKHLIVTQSLLLIILG